MNIATVFVSIEDAEQFVKILMKTENTFSCSYYENIEDNEYGYLITIRDKNDFGETE